MPTLDDRQFEEYLKEFQPLAPEPLCTERQQRAGRHPSVSGAWALATAAVVMLVAVIQFRHELLTGDQSRTVANSAPLQTLTVGSANILLSRAPSLREALDRMAFQSQMVQVPKDKISALTILSTEKTKL